MTNYGPYFDWLYERHNNGISTAYGYIDLDDEFEELDRKTAVAIFESWAEEAFIEEKS